MKTVLLLIAILLGGMIAVRRLVPAERRNHLRESLAHMPATMMERCMESMPEDSPPKAMMSSMRRFEEQNDELLALLREQNALLREQLPVQEGSSQA